MDGFKQEKEDLLIPTTLFEERKDVSFEIRAEEDCIIFSVKDEKAKKEEIKLFTACSESDKICFVVYLLYI